MRKMIQQGKLEDCTRIYMNGSTDGYQEFLFVFSVLSQPPLKESADLACRKLIVSFHIISNDWVVPQVSYNRKGNRPSRAERGYY
jgi:hypothetical protein